MKHEHSKENCELLAERVADLMDTKDLVAFVIDTLFDTYCQNEDGFIEDSHLLGE